MFNLFNAFLGVLMEEESNFQTHNSKCTYLSLLKRFVLYFIYFKAAEVDSALKSFSKEIIKLSFMTK